MGMPKNIVRLLLLAGLGLCLLQVWLPGYYLTGDGPCHLYNARIVHDLWSHTNTNLFNRFYFLADNPDPNWLSTVIMALLLFVAKGAIAEKIFLSIYVLLFVSGFYQLLRKIGGGNSYWLIAMFIFVFPLTLAKGFYNFSFSIAFYFWMVWSWLLFLEKNSIKNGLVFFLFATLIFFTHLLPFVFAAATCGALAVSYAWALRVAESAGGARRYFIRQVGWLFILLSPFLVLMGWFMQKQGGLQLHLAPHPYRLVELIQFKFIINLVNAEKLPSLIAGCILFALLAVASAKSFRRFTIHKYDGFLLSLLFVGFVYLFFPEDFMGRAIIISMRTQLFVFILIVCTITYRLPESNVKYAGAFLLFVCFGWLSVDRINCREKASLALADYLFAGNLIRPGSVVLPLSFSREGLDGAGLMIANRNSVFHHAADYLGLDQPLIILDNYEANINYFPVQWRSAVNPYMLLASGEGFEAILPFAAIAAYKQASGVSIDYIVMWCFQPSFLANEHFNTLYDEIRRGYHIAYTSPTKRTILWQRN
jgi:hypothetical protein